MYFLKAFLLTSRLCKALTSRTSVAPASMGTGVPGRKSHTPEPGPRGVACQASRRGRPAEPGIPCLGRGRRAVCQTGSEADRGGPSGQTKCFLSIKKNNNYSGLKDIKYVINHKCVAMSPPQNKSPWVTFRDCTGTSPHCSERLWVLHPSLPA